MHIIALEDEPTSLRGGQELNLFEICCSLAQRGHRISLLYGKDGNLLEQYRQFCDHTIKVDRYGFDRRRITNVIGFLPSLLKLPSIPIQSDSLVFSNSCHPAFFAYLLSTYRKLPLICYIQTPSLNFNRQKLIGLNGVTQFITVSEQMKRYWMTLGYAEKKVAVVHNGTSLDTFQPAQDVSKLREGWGIPEKAKVVAYVGRLDTEKGLDVLIQAFALLLKTKQEIRLLIAGKSIMSINLDADQKNPNAGKNYQQVLESLVAKLGLEKHVTFLGHVTDTASLYQVSDVTVVPSRWPEPFGRVVIESMACGTPVIASRTGGIPEILTGEFQANLVEPGNEQQLAAALQTVLSWKERDPTLGERCRQHVLNQFTLEKMVDGIEKVAVKVAGHG